jgi:hypothetical protein
MKIVTRIMLSCLVFVSASYVFADEFDSHSLDTLNEIRIYGWNGDTIELRTRILTGSSAVSDSSCHITVVGLSDQSIVLDVAMNYDFDEEHYDYYWVPEPPTLWEQFLALFNPQERNYRGDVSCTGGDMLGTTVLNDTIALELVIE